MERMCSMCRKSKDIAEFRYRKERKYYESYCRDCEKIYQREYQRARYWIKKEGAKK